MNTKEKGDISVAVVLTELCKVGYTVLIPWGDKDRYDLVAEKNGTFSRIQVKTAWKAKNGIRFNTASVTTKNGTRVRQKYNANQVDLFIVYDPDDNSLYCIPISEATSTDCLLRTESAKNGQKKLVKVAADYSFEGCLPE